jgi:ketosteroid isomerase-like protein
MSRENVEFLKNLLAGAANVDKHELLHALPGLVSQIYTPDVEWVEDPERADARTYRGHDGVLESFERWLEQWGEYGFEAEQFVDCGDDVLVVGREYGTGAVSGANVSARIYVVVTFRDGKITRYREFYDERAALDAAGLAELPAD